VKHQRETKFCYLSVFTLYEAVLLWRVGTRDMLLDSRGLKKSEEGVTDEFTSSIALKGSNGGLKLVLNQSLELNKGMIEI